MNNLKNIGTRLPFVCTIKYKGTRQSYEEGVNKIWNAVSSVEHGKFSEQFPVNSTGDVYKFLGSHEDRLCVLDMSKASALSKDEDIKSILNTALIYFEYDKSERTLIPVVNLIAIRESCIIEDCISADTLFFKHFRYIEESGKIRGLAATREFNTFVSNKDFDKMAGILIVLV